MDILSMSASSLAGISFKCECGMTHACDMKEIVAGRGVLGKITGICVPYAAGGKKLLLVCDNYTYEAAGKKALDLLSGAGLDTELFMFKTDIPLVPDEKTLGRLLLKADGSLGLIVTVGSGVLNDTCRLVSARTGIPYVIVATAPSMDGYASNSSPIITEGMKFTFPAVYPVSMLADYGILCGAPRHMLAAGFGDIIGKYISLVDWSLALGRGLPGRDNNLDCPVIRGLVKNAIKKCVDTVDGIKTGDVKTVENLLDALILTGQAMGFIGITRPASGCEHKFSHYWESGFVRDDLPHDLHGTMVGVGTAVASRIYEYMNKKGLLDLTVPPPGEIDGLLDRAGAKKSPVELGVSREVFIESFEGARVVSAHKYTILDLAHDKGLMSELAEALAEYYY